MREFRTVELNASYYRWPTDAAFTHWRRRFPADFILSVKAPRALTHAKRLYAPESWLARIARGLDLSGALRRRGVGPTAACGRVRWGPSRVLPPMRPAKHESVPGVPSPIMAPGHYLRTAAGTRRGVLCDERRKSAMHSQGDRAVRVTCGFTVLIITTCTQALTVTMNSGGGPVASSSGRPWAMTSSSISTTTEAEMLSGTLGR